MRLGNEECLPPKSRFTRDPIPSPRLRRARSRVDDDAVDLVRPSCRCYAFAEPQNHKVMMKSLFAPVLQVVLVLVGIGVLALLLLEPHLEGRNVHSTTFEVYFKDPFLAYVYLGSTPFFVALYRTIGLLAHARRTGAFSQITVDALQSIQHCAIAIIGFAALGTAFIFMFGDHDDRPAGLFMSLLVTLSSGAIAFAASKFARSLKGVLTRSGDSQG